MYARGLSVRDIEDALRDATGQPLLSRNAVSALSDTLWEDDELQPAARPGSGTYGPQRIRAPRQNLWGMPPATTI
jgi:hypothetical protein